MTTTVVGTVVDGSNVPVEGVKVVARLVAADDPDAPGYLTSAEVFGDAETETDDEGGWTLELIPNADVTPADTVYAVSYVAAGRDFTLHIEVPDSVDDEWVGDLLTVVPENFARVELDDLADVSTSGATDGQALVYDDGTDSWGPGTVSGGPGGGAPTDATYLVTTANGDLSDEVVVGTSPGGELGGTWASPTVDATHSGSTHAAVQAAAEATAAGALSSHDADTTNVHGIADTSALATTTDLSNHASDTTNIHGITDTSALETTTGAQSKVDTHVNDTSAAHAASAISFSAGGTIAGTDVQTAVAEVATDAASALSSHESDTTSIHGIADTSALLTNASAGHVRQVKSDAGATYSNSSSATTLFAGGLYDIPANSVSVGDVFEIYAFGSYLNNSGGGRDIGFNFLADAVDLGAVATGFLANVVEASATARFWEARCTIRVDNLSTPASGVFNCFSSFWLSAATNGVTGTFQATGTAAEQFSDRRFLAATVDTTQALSLDLKATLSANTSTQTVTCEGITIVKRNAP